MGNSILRIGALSDLKVYSGRSVLRVGRLLYQILIIYIYIYKSGAVLQESALEEYMSIWSTTDMHTEGFLQLTQAPFSRLCYARG